MSQKRRWHILVFVMLLPLAIPFLAGGYWLWLNHLLIWWIAASAALALSWWSVNQLFKKYRPEPKWLDISDSMVRTKQSEQAWRKIEAISVCERGGNPDLSDSRFYLDALIRVMNQVAEVYYPQQKQAVLEIKIPYLLKVVEIFAQELRLNFTENVPGSHLFSINDLAKGRRIAGKGRELYRLFRIVTAGIDPVSAVIRELRMFANANMLADSAVDLKRRLIDAYIKKVGYYAIELYSGNLALDDDAFSKPTRKTQQEIKKIRAREKSLHAEPFRLLIVGQTNAGKASLVNAMADKQMAISVPTPNPLHSQTYLLRPAEFPATIIADSQRYEASDSGKHRQTLLKTANRSDVVILAVSATNPANQIDKSILDDIKRLDNNPRILIALTHIDRLRPFREWQPPYDFSGLSSAKARSIHECAATIARRLEIDPAQIVPVCLHGEKIYNVRERLLPLLLQQFELNDAKRHLRCLDGHKREQQQKRLWKQIRNAGVWLSHQGVNWLSKPKPLYRGL